MTDEIYTQDLVLIAGESRDNLTLTWGFSSGSISSPVTTVFRNGEDISSDVLSGSESSSGVVQTARELTPLAQDGGQRYVLEWECTYNGNTYRENTMIIVVARGMERGI